MAGAAGGAGLAVEMGTLPRYLRRTLDEFPKAASYLIADATEAAHWREELAALPRPLIGICWRSGGAGGHRAVQHAPLERWADFIRELPGSAVCVQYDAREDEIAALKTMSGRDIVVPKGIDQKRELDRAAALFLVLDAVASAPTAVSWLSAAMGVATFKLLYDTSWTSFGEPQEPFAPSAACVTANRRGDWEAVFADTLARIRALRAPA